MKADKLLLSDAKMVEKFGPSQKRYLRGVVDFSVSKVDFKGLQPKIVLPFLKSSRRMKFMHACKTQMVI